MTAPGDLRQNRPDAGWYGDRARRTAGPGNRGETLDPMRVASGFRRRDSALSSHEGERRVQAPCCAQGRRANQPQQSCFRSIMQRLHAFADEIPAADLPQSPKN